MLKTLNYITAFFLCNNSVRTRWRTNIIWSEEGTISRIGRT